MQPSLPLLNWSLKKLLDTLPDAFAKAKAEILFWILLLSLVKILVVLAASWYADQNLQLQRALVLLCTYTVLLKALLVNKAYLKAITHVMLGMGLLLIWSNVLVFAQSLNVISIQFISMLIISSFYLLTVRAAFIYCALAMIPVVMSLAFREQFSVNFIPAGELASPGHEIIIILNFVTIILAQYLFKQAFVDNIAEKEALNLQLQLAVKEANLAAASKSDFLSTMSHELRTPLNAVIGISEVLLTDPHTQEQEENLNILKFSADNLHTLINDILDFNKLGSGKLNLETIPVDLNKLMIDLTRSLRFQAVQKGIAFVLDIDEAISQRWVVTDPTRITQIVYNLAGNAIKFTAVGSVTLGARVLQTSDNGLTVKVFVTDTGIGISEAQQEAIFEPFTQASSSTTRNFGGTGLGLAIVKQLLVLFDSAIKLESTPGMGSTFSFELALPLGKVPQVTISPGAELLYDLHGLRILVAEDNPMNRILLVKVFSKWNVNAVFVSNGQEAVEKLGLEAFDVILMDLHMPVMDGYEASRVIRALADTHKAGIRIIALTASESGNLNEKIKQAGMDGFIIKPFKKDELYRCLQEEVLSAVEHA
jgi:signal transduction histidine kinase/CheY-like chemotaxis protein